MNCIRMYLHSFIDYSKFRQIHNLGIFIQDVPEHVRRNLSILIKLIEQLYRDGEIPAYMFRNILNEYADVVDLAQFTVMEEREEEAA